MKAIVKLKANPNIAIPFDGCYPQYFPNTREVVIYNLQMEVQAVYDAEVLYDEVIWKL